MNRVFAIAAAAAQVLVLAFMAGQREWVVRTGQPVLLRTAPIDPRDPMRGDYVRLDYEISSVPRALCRDGVARWFDDNTIYRREVRDRRVFAQLELDEIGIARITALTDREPADGLFLRGRTDWIDSRAIRVRYGIEALFMEQGAARAFEYEMRDDKAGVPINAEVAVSPGGLAVLRSYRWEPLGITIEVRRGEPAGNVDDPVVRNRRGINGAAVTLKNHSDAPVAVVDLPRAGSFRLVVAERWSDGTVVPVERSAPPMPTAADVVLLQPGDTHVVQLDFSDRAWFVITPPAQPGTPAVPVALESLTEAWSAWFRIEYVPPGRDACAGLPHAEAIRHAPLRSRSFSPSGGMD